jgi:nucleoside-diphosphate-sugar epimerase
MKKAVVAGGLGVIGRNLVEHLARLDDWEVVGPSRRSPDFCSRAQFIWVDLLDRADCERKLANLTDVTHLFSRRTKTAPLQLEQVGPNLAMLRNLVDVLEQRGASIERTVLFQGAKRMEYISARSRHRRWKRTRATPPNFEYDEENFLRSRRMPGRCCGRTLFAVSRAAIP